MMTETIATLMILILCWIILILLDCGISAILALCGVVCFKKAFLYGLLSLLIPPVFIITGTIWGRNRLEVNSIEIVFDKLPREFDGYRIVHISDIHARSFAGREDFMKEAVDKINSLNPDLIAFTGDLITLTPDEIDNIAHSLMSLMAKDGVVSVLGNHDYCTYSDADKETKKQHLNDVKAKEKALGWQLLLNENSIIRRGADSIAIIGVENTSPLKMFDSNGDLTKASDGTEGMFRILLSHDPMHWEAEILGKDYPLTLSGHTHAMQVSILGWSPSRLIFKQNRGLYSKNGQHLYVNIGLGETIFPARIGAHPEITEIRLSSYRE